VGLGAPRDAPVAPDAAPVGERTSITDGRFSIPCCSFLTFHFSHFAIGKFAGLFPTFVVFTLLFHPESAAGQRQEGTIDVHTDTFFAVLNISGGFRQLKPKNHLLLVVSSVFYYFVELPLDFIRPSEWKSRNSSSSSSSTTAHRRQQQDKRDRGYNELQVSGARWSILSLVFVYLF
jgi:hypothetical protein